MITNEREKAILISEMKQKTWAKDYLIGQIEAEQANRVEP